MANFAHQPVLRAAQTLRHPAPATRALAHPERYEAVVITFAEFSGQSLVSASQDIGECVQALILLERLLRETVEGDVPRQLLARLEHKLVTLADLLGTPIETNRSDADDRENETQIFKVGDAPALNRTMAVHPSLPSPVAYIVDDNPQIRSSLRDLLEGHAMTVEDFASAEAFLKAYRPGSEGCLLLDAHLLDMSSLDLLAALRECGDHLPTILISGSHDVSLAVDAMRGGAYDFLEKPVGRRDLLASITRAIEGSHDICLIDAAREEASAGVAALTARQHEIFDLVLAGHPSKNIAADLGISQRTVENHRAAIMRKMHAKSLPDLARKAQAAVTRQGRACG
jgi:FixJ family two-component response regulator